jgi:hypothetical protein
VAWHEDESRQGFWSRRKKSEFKVERNLLEKTFACRRGIAGIEHKIGDFRRKKDLLTQKMPQIKAILAPID